MLKKASEMTEDELRAEFAKLEARRAARRERNRARAHALTPEAKAKRAAYAKKYRERQREVCERAKRLTAPATTSTAVTPAKTETKSAKKA